MDIYIFIGGAYGDSKWVSQTPPNSDDYESWGAGETEIFKVDSDMRVYEPDGSGAWTLLAKK